MAAAKLDSILTLPAPEVPNTKWDALLGAEPFLDQFADQVEALLETGKRYRLTIIVEECPPWYPVTEQPIG